MVDFLNFSLNLRIRLIKSFFDLSDLRIRSGYDLRSIINKIDLFILWRRFRLTDFFNFGLNAAFFNILFLCLHSVFFNGFFISLNWAFIYFLVFSLNLAVRLTDFCGFSLNSHFFNVFMISLHWTLIYFLIFSLNLTIRFADLVNLSDRGIHCRLSLWSIVRELYLIILSWRFTL